MSTSGESPSIISWGFGANKKKNRDDSTFSQSSGSDHPTSLKQTGMNFNTKKTIAVRQDGFGFQPDTHSSDVKISSLTYLKDESEASRAFEASQHYAQRGRFWNEGKREILVRYFQLAMIGLCQGTIAYFVNFLCRIFTDVRYSITILFFFNLCIHPCIHNPFFFLNMDRSSLTQLLVSSKIKCG
jgi:hypothetical protein